VKHHVRNRKSTPTKNFTKNNVFFGKAFFFKERFIGTIIGMLLVFIGRVILLRFITQTEYEIYSLALVVVSIFATIFTLELQEGSTRYIAYFRGRNEEKIFKCKDKISLGDEYGDKGNSDI
jgi:c-di-AMP phosphodiesterase-like protein